MPPKTSEPIRLLPAIALEQSHADAFLSRIDTANVPSLLFTGPEGTGKEYAAIEFARALCCMNPTTCDVNVQPCDSCRMASRLEHPGLHLIHPTPTQGSNEGDDGDVSDISKVLDEKRRDIFGKYRFTKKASIRIARARAVIQRANTKPFDSPYHVFIFIDAHAMREEAQNALLKLVEEPPPHSVVIFTTTNPDGILYTIRSRCQRVRFSPLKPTVVERVLKDYYGVDTRVAKRAAALSQGSINRAAQLAESFDDDERQQAAAVAAGLTVEAESWAIGQALMAGKGSNREGVARFLDELSLVFRDVMAGDPELYVNQELTKQIGGMAKRWDRAALPGVIEKIAQARAEILLGNMNIDATLTRLFLDIHRSR
jgi:DNA polymerase-3 subunit delta'